ncbi:MAG: Enoyl-CoA hydratase/isomerase [Phenylobacterium sp.]|nr:Enoyl-CoA hydratase/isomerase [Phenylobacterium sp.]
MGSPPLPTPTFETLLYSVEDGIATITLNRPEILNAFNAQMCEDLIAAFDATDADDGVGAVIVTGAGRAFCSGADLSGQGFNREKPPETPRDAAGRVTLRIFDSLKPVIAACNGAAVGVGVTMQLAMDVRLAAENARYGFVFPRRGITVEGCATWFLPRIVGPAAAIEWCTSGRIFPAQEGLDKGMVQSIHAPDDLLPAARAIAREIVDNAAPVSAALTRQMIYRMMGAQHPMEAHIYESRSLFHRFGAADSAEGVKSFMEKRPAKFPMKVSEELPDIWQGWQAPPWRP